ncbi:MAG TPA: hypothetical protein VJZ71_10775 [Phycisphaerae bacterium]|nr:hypothetical protein [Phycisphaerae bacterium]
MSVSWDTVAGGLIAAISGAAAIIIADRLGRRNKQSDSEREAIIAWATAFEEWIAIYQAFSVSLNTMSKGADDMRQQIFRERWNKADESGRRLDVAKNCVRIVSRRDWVRDEVVRMSEMTSEIRKRSSKDDPSARAIRQSEREELQKALSDFISRIANATTT